jgi:hypothetical protein
VGDPDNPLQTFFWTVLAEGLVGIIAIGGTIGIGEAALRGERRSWLHGLADGMRGWPQMFSSRFLAGLVLTIAAVAFLLPALYLGVRYSLSDCAAIVERRSGMNAVGRSMELTRGRFLIFLGLCVITIVPLVVAGFLIFMPLDLYPQIDHWLLSAALGWLIDLLEPWMTLVFVAAYFQRRAEERHESQPVPATLAGP